MSDTQGNMQNPNSNMDICKILNPRKKREKKIGQYIFCAKTRMQSTCALVRIPAN